MGMINKICIAVLLSAPIFSGCEAVDSSKLGSVTVGTVGTVGTADAVDTEEPTVAEPVVVEPAGSVPDSVVEPDSASGAVTDSSTVTATPLATPTATATPDPTPSAMPSATPSPSPSPTPSPSPSPSASPTPYVFSGGAGTSGNPYQLETAQDVQNIGQASSAYFTVVQDINMSGISFSPITSFSGTLYGNNRHLYNLTITTTGSTKAVLFTSMSGTLVGLVIQNVTSSAATYAGGLVGSLTGLVSACGTSGVISSPSGGNGFNTGTGNSVYVTKSGAGSVINTTQAVTFNGNNVTYKFP